MVLVTGASGFIGRAVAGRLRRHCFAARGLVRAASAAESLALLGAEVVRGDVRDAAALAPAVEGTTAIVHCAAIPRERRGETFETVHVRAVERLVEAARAARVKRLVLLSPLGARADSPSRLLRTRWQGEEVVRRSGIDHVILRPALVVGPGDRFTCRIAAVLRWNPILPLPRSGEARVQPIHVDDLVTAVVYAVVQDRLHKETIDLGCAEPLTLRDAVKAIGRAVEHEVVPIAVPARALAAVLAIAEKVPGSRIGRESLAIACEDRVCSLERARDLLGLEPRPFEASLAHLRGNGR